MTIRKPRAKNKPPKPVALPKKKQNIFLGGVGGTIKTPPVLLPPEVANFIAISEKLINLNDKIKYASLKGGTSGKRWDFVGGGGNGTFDRNKTWDEALVSVQRGNEFWADCSSMTYIVYKWAGAKGTYENMTSVSIQSDFKDFQICNKDNFSKNQKDIKLGDIVVYQNHVQTIVDISESGIKTRYYMFSHGREEAPEIKPPQTMRRITEDSDPFVGIYRWPGVWK